MPRKEHNQETLDLTNLATKRCREAFLLVSQLVDSDSQRAGMAAAVALDFINGSGAMLSREKRYAKYSEKQLFDMVVATMVEVAYENFGEDVEALRKKLYGK